MTRWVWTAPSGLVTELSAWDLGNYVTADGTGGVLAPEYEFATQELAGIDGADVQSITAAPGSPLLGLDLTASDPAELRQRVRALAHALRPRAGIGTLTAVADDGSARSVRCYYRRGLERSIPHAVRYRTALEFYAPSPWWRGEPLHLEWSLAAPGAFFPILPLTLSASTIAGSLDVDLSDTDAPTYPRWVITGPGSQLTLTNTYDAVQPDGTVEPVTQSFAVTPPGGFGDGQLVVVTTRPGHQDVNRATRAADGTLILGESVFGSLAGDPALFPLVDGVNRVSALLTNAGPASRIVLDADRLHSGAL